MIESNYYLFAIRNDIERRKGSEVAIDRRSTIDVCMIYERNELEYNNTMHTRVL